MLARRDPHDEAAALNVAISACEHPNLEKLLSWFHFSPYSQSDILRNHDRRFRMAYTR